jgi:hypothetical protein
MTGSPPSAQREGRPRRDRRPRIAAGGLEQNVGFRSDLCKLLGDQKTILSVGDGDRAPEQHRIGHAPHGILEGRKAAEQR